MLYRILADLVVLLHLLFIIFVVAGGLLALPRAWLALLHLAALIWGIYIEFSGEICPLTPLENYFSRLAGDEEYSTSFIYHYLIPVIYPAGLTREVQIFLGLLVIVLNLAVYSFVLRRYLNRREDKKSH
jgi:hypothetical protein